jgi:hypothetical protein
MIILTHKARAFIGSAVETWGTDEQILIWGRWARDNPQVRRGPDDPFDDNKSPIVEDLKNTIMDCLRQRFDFLIAQSKSLVMDEDEIADASNDAGYIRSIAHGISGENPNWSTE